MRTHQIQFRAPDRTPAGRWVSPRESAAGRLPGRMYAGALSEALTIQQLDLRELNLAASPSGATVSQFDSLLVAFVDVGVYDLGGVANCHQSAVVQSCSLVAHRPHRAHRVAHDDDRLARPAGTRRTSPCTCAGTLASPTASTSSTSRMSGSTLIATEKPEPHVHARRVVLHRRVDELLEAGEVDDLVELRVELASASARGSSR